MVYAFMIGERPIKERENVDCDVISMVEKLSL